MDKTRRDLMAQRDAAMAARDFTTANALTRQIANLPLRGVPELTPKDIARYVSGKRRRAS